MRSKAFLPDRSYFNPRSPRGGATSFVIVHLPIMAISIHAPHEGERLEEIEFTRTDDTKFQSTLPTRGSDGVAGRF